MKVNRLIENNIQFNQNIFTTAIEVHNMFINILTNKLSYNNSIIGKMNRNNKCINYNIVGGCFCNL